MAWQFWRWLLRGLNSTPGYKRLITGWLLVHILIGVGTAIVVPVKVCEASRAILLPLTGMFIGLSFSWIGNAQALLQQDEIERIAEHHPDGIDTYVYTFQLAVLVILTTLVFWGLAGLSVFDSRAEDGTYLYFGVESGLYCLVSITLRECWHVVMGSQELLRMRRTVRSIRDRG